MQTVSLPYGSSGFALSFDPERFEIVAPPEVPHSTKQFLIDSQPLEEIARGKRVLLIVSDLTRPTGSQEFLPPLLESIRGASKVAFLFATGLHRPLKDADKIAIVGETISKSYPMLDHYPDQSNVYTGTTSRGNRVEINSQVFDYDLIVLTGSIGFHYFAGFTGGRKSLMPGVAAQQTIHFNHLLVLNQDGPGRNPDVRVARLEGNPVHEDIVEAVKLVGKPLFVFNTILDRRKKNREGLRRTLGKGTSRRLRRLSGFTQRAAESAASAGRRQCGRFSPGHQHDSDAQGVRVCAARCGARRNDYPACGMPGGNGPSQLLPLVSVYGS